FVYWRVEYALNRQLDQDLDAYDAVVVRDIATGDTPTGHTPGQSYQLYDAGGRVIGGDAKRRLADTETVTRARAGETIRKDVGSLLPPSGHPYRLITSRVKTSHGPVVVA